MLFLRFRWLLSTPPVSTAGDLFDGSLLLQDVGAELWEVERKAGPKLTVMWGTDVDDFDPATQVGRRAQTVAGAQAVNQPDRPARRAAWLGARQRWLRMTHCEVAGNLHTQLHMWRTCMLCVGYRVLTV